MPTTIDHRELNDRARRELARVLVDAWVTLTVGRLVLWGLLPYRLASRLLRGVDGGLT